MAYAHNLKYKGEALKTYESIAGGRAIYMISNSSNKIVYLSMNADNFYYINNQYWLHIVRIEKYKHNNKTKFKCTDYLLTKENTLREQGCLFRNIDTVQQAFSMLLGMVKIDCQNVENRIAQIKQSFGIV